MSPFAPRKCRNFRGAKGDNTTVIDSLILSFGASGPDLKSQVLEEGKKEASRIGEKRTWEKAILALLAARHGTVPSPIQDKVAKLTPAEAERMMQFLAECQSLGEVTQWLARSKTKGLKAENPRPTRRR